MMSRPVGWRGLRPRIAAAIAGVTILAVGASFLALYRGTGADLRGRIDSELKGQTEDYLRRVADPARTEAGLVAATRAYLAQLSFQPASRIILVQLSSGQVLTNEPEVVEREGEEHRDGGGGGAEEDGGKDSSAGESGGGIEDRESEDREAGGGEDDSGGGEGRTLLDAPPGLADVSVHDAGAVRVLSTPIELGGVPAGVFRAGAPLQPVERAESGLLRSFILVGSIAALVAVLIGIWIASRASRPLRDMAAIAAAVEAGDLSRRIEHSGPRDEVGVLAEAFNSMLARVQAAFDRQREFAADASHELRTPLTVIRGQLEVLAQEKDPGQRDVRRTIEIVTRETDRMARLVDDLLLLARAEEGTLVHKADIDVRRFFTDLGDELTLLADRDWRLPSPPAGRIEADPDRMAQAVRNLVRNAVEHTEDGGSIAVDVTAGDGRLRIAVADDGPGIPPQQLGRIFDRFHRVDSARSRQDGGAGLGLAIARAIVEGHGGHIRAASTLGHGSTFTIELPGYRAA